MTRCSRPPSGSRTLRAVSSSSSFRPRSRPTLDLASLEVCPGSFVDEELRVAHTDLLYTVRTTANQVAFVYVLFEHQSSFDATMPLRLLRYVVRIWETWLRNHSGSSKLPLVIPVIMHHGASGWRVAPELASILDADPELLEATRPYVPHFQFVLDDLEALSLDALSSRVLHALGRLVQLAMWSSRSLARLQEAAPLMQEIRATLTRDERTRALLMQLYAYLFSADVDADQVRTILLGVAGPEGREDVMTAAEQLREQGRAEGRAEGQLAALRSALDDVLAARSLTLSDLARTRVTSCTDGVLLSHWLRRAATATSETEIFS